MGVPGKQYWPILAWQLLTHVAVAPPEAVFRMYPPLQVAAVGVPEHPPLVAGHWVHMVAWVLAAKYPVLQVRRVLLQESVFNEGHVAHTDIPAVAA